MLVLLYGVVRGVPTFRLVSGVEWWCVAGFGSAGLGLVGRGRARLGRVRHGGARHGAGDLRVARRFALRRWSDDRRDVFDQEAVGSVRSADPVHVGVAPARRSEVVLAGVVARDEVERHWLTAPL